MAKHSPALAHAVVDSGAVEALVGCLEEFDPGVKEAAAWALGYIARHNGGMYHPHSHLIRAFKQSLCSVTVLFVNLCTIFNQVPTYFYLN